MPLTQLLSKTYAASLCDRIKPDSAAPTLAPAAPTGGTIYLTTADRWDNMVSLIHSVFSTYGSKATVGPYGFVLQNRGGGFSLDPASPNIVAPDSSRTPVSATFASSSIAARGLNRISCWAKSWHATRKAR